MSLANLEKAKEQYLEGLKVNPENTHLLTDYGNYFLLKYSKGEHSKNLNTKDYLEKALQQLTKSYGIDPKNQNTLYKLSLAHLLNNDCKNAKKFYNLCKNEGGNPITEEYKRELKRICK